MTWRAPADRFAGRAAFILGGGPSLTAEDVNRIKGRGAVIAVNNAGLDLAPWADVLFFADGWPRWFGWNKDRLHEFKGDLIVSRAAVPQTDPRLVTITHDNRSPLSRHPSKVAGHCGGSSAINLAYLMGARVIVLMGFDMRGGNWHQDHKAPPLPNAHRDRFIPALERMAPELEAEGVLVINTNPDSALRCFPFADLGDLLTVDNLADIEADKYRRIWERPEYRRISPGMMEAERAFVSLYMQPGQTLIDFGAGTGRATAFFRDRGLEVLAVDFAENALETSVPYVNACLWDMPELSAEIGYCCDVMEHIPPQKVGEVLAGIRARISGAVYFRIATRSDRMGSLIGSRLHLTVQSGEWWRRQIEAHWRIVDVVENNGRDLVAIARPGHDI